MQAAPQYFRIVCPGCASVFRVAVNHRGRKTRCPKCAHVLTIEESAPGIAANQPAKPQSREAQEGAPTERRPAAATSLKQSQSNGSGQCGYCLGNIAAGESTARCPACNAIHHRECWDENKGCTRYGCSEAPEDNAIPRHDQTSNNRKACGSTDPHPPDTPSRGTGSGNVPDMCDTPAVPSGGSTGPPSFTHFVDGFFSDIGIRDYRNYLVHIAGAALFISIVGLVAKVLALLGLSLAIPMMFLTGRFLFEDVRHEAQETGGKYYLSFAISVFAIILSGFGLFS